MKTKFDPVVRLRQRALDQLAAELGQAARRAADAVERHRAELARQNLERSAIAADPFCDPQPWLAQAKIQTEALEKARAVAEAELDALRQKAARLLGERRAFERAADRVRDEWRTTIQRREQAMIDEVAGRPKP
jgi:hypothetical protein